MHTAQDHHPMPEHLDAVDSQPQHNWNARYQEIAGVPQAAYVLWENQHLLPATGRALDLACGLGGNALLLAARGLDTWAWDISDIAVARVQAAAQQRGVTLHAEVRDVVACPPCAESFDVIVVSRFLERALVPALMEALRPAGLLFYQTFTQVTVGDVKGPMNPAYRLAPQELFRLFHPLRILVYREEGSVGDTTRGLRNEALLVAQKG
jgi:SAM-dependent methyltransferase